MELDTKNCCFICLCLIETDLLNKSSLNTDQNKNDKTSIKSMCKLLKIDQGILCKHTSKETPADVKVLLCDDCQKVNKKLSELVIKLEAIYLETDYYMGEMHKRISNSYKDEELVQNYCRRMTSNREGLQNLLNVANLRKLVTQKSSTTRFTSVSANLELQKCPEGNEAESICLGSGTPISTQIVKSEGETEDVTEQEVEAEMDLPITDSNLTEYDDPLFETNILNLGLDKSEIEQVNSVTESPLHMTPPPPVTKPIGAITNKCSTCNKIFSKKWSLDRHIRDVHLMKRIKCKMCGDLILLSNFRHKKVCPWKN